MFILRRENNFTVTSSNMINGIERALATECRISATNSVERSNDTTQTPLFKSKETLLYIKYNFNRKKSRVEHTSLTCVRANVRESRKSYYTAHIHFSSRRPCPIVSSE